MGVVRAAPRPASEAARVSDISWLQCISVFEDSMSQRSSSHSLTPPPVARAGAVGDYRSGERADRGRAAGRQVLLRDAQLLPEDAHHEPAGRRHMGRHVRACRTPSAPFAAPPRAIRGLHAAHNRRRQSVRARVRACFQVGSRLLKGWLGCRLGFKRISLSVVSTNELKHMTTDGPMTMTRSAAV